MDMALQARELRDIAPFASLPRDQQTAVLRAAQVRTYRHGERVFHAGEGCTTVTILLDGLVRVFRTSPDGMEITTAIISSRSIVAMAMLRGSALYDAHADAIGPVRTVEVSIATFLGLVSQYPGFSEAVVSGLITRTDDTFMAINRDVDGPLWSQILRTLRKLGRPSYPADDEAMLRLACRLSHAEIARLVGAHRSSVTRALRLLGERGLVRLEHGRVTGVRS